MATALPIKKIDLTVVEGERDLALVNKLLAETYTDQGYDKVPKTKEEAKGGSFNGEMASFTSIQICPDGVIEAEIMSTRYLFRDATIDIAKKYGDYVAREVGIRMAHVSFIAVDIFEGQPVIIAQLKGDAVGKGQIHAGLVAGAITKKHLATTDPLHEALKERLREEMGLDINLLPQPPKSRLMVGEEENGFVNIVAVGHMGFEEIKKSYLKSIEGKPLEKRQVSGLALIPIHNASSIKEGAQVFYPDEKGGGYWKPCKKGLRPYTNAILDFLEKPENQEWLIEQAGL